MNRQFFRDLARLTLVLDPPVLVKVVRGLCGGLIRIVKIVEQIHAEFLLKGIHGHRKRRKRLLAGLIREDEADGSIGAVFPASQQRHHMSGREPLPPG